MSSPEFNLIKQFFTEQRISRPDVSLGIGDDAALVSPPAGMSLAVSTDMLLSGVHFPEQTSAAAIAYKALAVNLSDMAAMGAEPAWFTLSISLPEVDENWLGDFSQGLFAIANTYGVQLIGGDTTRGPLCMSVQIMGFCPEGKALTRSGAQIGDGVFLTGTVGDAGLGLALQQDPLRRHYSAENEYLIDRLEYPTPRVSAGIALRNIATSAIDISDGLAADLKHVLNASGVGADIEIERLPLSTAFVGEQRATIEKAWQFAVSAGDDYELCFTAPMSQETAIQERLNAENCPCVCIGRISAPHGLRWRDANKIERQISVMGFDHFQGNN
ncbi:MAG: thiamine-phosphate kinase [Ectothiorhodospiraceae bacterium]|nr:thiamine-phosphate kinase [Ectothiorhodospiraceae bacterium]